MPGQTIKILLAKHRGFCAGVKRSIRLAEQSQDKMPGPIYILNELAHNTAVVKNLEIRGLWGVKSIDEVKSGTLIISAHGIPDAVIEQARAKGLKIVDTTCPLVKYIHRLAKKHTDNDRAVIVFGDPGHDEVKGILGVAPDKIMVLDGVEDIASLPRFDRQVVLISQSTRSLDDFQAAAGQLKRRFNDIKVINTICRPTLDRQSSIKQLAPSVDLVIVVGSPNSANSRRLVAVAEGLGRAAYLIDNASQLDVSWLEDIGKIGLTAGASTPNFLVEEVVVRIKQYGLSTGRDIVVSEVF